MFFRHETPSNGREDLVATPSNGREDLVATPSNGREDLVALLLSVNCITGPVRWNRALYAACGS